VTRALFEDRVHRFISERNDVAYSTLLGALGAVERIP
jgi:hypothetical protein